MNIEHLILSFDTELFGFKVAKILTPRISAIELQKVLMQLATQDVRLVYWPSDSLDEVSQQAAKQLQGFLGSQQVVYSMNLHKLSENFVTSEDIDIYSSKEANSDLENLALQAGTFSHFKTDPKFPNNLFIKLYITWIKNSLNGQLKEIVMVAKHGSKIAGLITVGTKDGRGYIGLLAVYSEYRGQNIGTHLVRAAQKYWLDNGLIQGQVVTQQANKAACGLYEKCGFKQEKIENFYHFWL
jgi:dTDP-4-amino-4,6-dideoxy-D-galactose acyltransferase